MEVLENESRTRILKEFEIVRSTTMNLVKTLEADDYPVQTAPYTSPPKWHIGHTSWIYETVMSKINTEYEFYSKEYSKYLNSYYQQFGMPHDKSKRGHNISSHYKTNIRNPAIIHLSSSLKNHSYSLNV